MPAMLPLRFALFFLFLAPVLPAAAQSPTAGSAAGNAAQDGLGKITFPNSCAPTAQPDLLKGMVLLHSFQYSASEQAFADVAKADQHCAMAYWGMAMTVYHPLWEGAPEHALVRGRDFLAKIQKDWPMTAREHEYVDAL